MTLERTKEISRCYHRAMDEVEDIVACALCETYRGVTGKPASDRLREAIAEAVRYHSS